MEQAMTPTEVASALGLPALKDRKWQIFKTSATKGTGLEEAMDWYVLQYYTIKKKIISKCINNKLNKKKKPQIWLNICCIERNKLQKDNVCFYLDHVFEHVICSIYPE